MKNEEGKRVFDPEENKRISERHYQRLYANLPLPHHEYHDEVKEKMKTLSGEETEIRPLDLPPSKKEIEEAIKLKKNKKATTDWPNEILKKGGEPMIDIIEIIMKVFC